MAFFNFTSRLKKRSHSGDGIIRYMPESLINPLYKPKTLGELKALMVATGRNPSPVSLRPGIAEGDVVDPMDLPPVPVGGDTFETIRATDSLQKTLLDEASAYQKSQQSSEDPSQE